MPAAALPSMERFLTGVLDAPLAAPLECGMPDCMRGGERTPPGYRIETNIAPSYETKLPDKYESMAKLSEATVPYSPAMPATYDRKVGDDIASILDSSFPMWDKRDALSRVKEENRFTRTSEYLSGMNRDGYDILKEATEIAARKEAADARNKYDIVQEAEEIAAERWIKHDPAGIGPARMYDLSKDNVILTGNPEIDARYNSVLKDPTPLQAGGAFFGTGYSRDDNKINFVVDRRLRGTSEMAYVIHADDVEKTLPREGRMLREAYGPRLMALNPDVIETATPGMTAAYAGTLEQLKSIVGHELFHTKEPGKTAAKMVQYPVFVHLGRHIVTGEDVYIMRMIPGEALVEGGVEYAMGRMGLKPPTDFMPKGTLYRYYRQFVEGVEAESPGFTRGFLKVAERDGPEAAAAYMHSAGGNAIVKSLRRMHPGVDIIKMPSQDELFEGQKMLVPLHMSELPPSYSAN